MDTGPMDPSPTDETRDLPMIPITRPLFGPEEFEAIQRPLETGWVVQGPFVAEFEQRFSEFTGAAHSIASTSCTTALHLAVAALGLKPGDEVIVPAFTWVATANVVEYMGARPVFCDIDLATFNIDVDQARALVGPRTVGIIPVHLFGLAADMVPLLDLARSRSLWLIEDAACGFGASYHGQHVGTFGDAGCFSFHPRKSITTGEGGMVTTQRDDVARLARSLRDHGASRTDLDRHQRAGFLLAEYDVLGYNYRMTDFQGALGTVQLSRADAVLAARRERAARYDLLLADLGWLGLPQVPEGLIHGYQSYVTMYQPSAPTLATVQALSDERNALMARLESSGIATRQGTHAPVLQGFYRSKYELSGDEYPNAILADRLSISLPLYPQMTDEEQDRVIRAFREHVPA